MKGILSILILLLFGNLADAQVKLRGPYPQNPGDPAKLVQGNICKLVAGKSYPILKFYYLSNNRKEIILPKEYMDYFGFTEAVKPQFNQPYCSASVIDQQHILTAAHCYKGSIEYGIKKGTLILPWLRKIIVGGKEKIVREKGCHDPYWERIPGCVKMKINMTVQEELGDITVECPGENGRKEVRKLDISEGWPNPLMSGSRPIFDVAVWRTDAPFYNIKPIKLELNQKKVEEIVSQYGEFCYAVGFSKDSSSHYFTEEYLRKLEETGREDEAQRIRTSQNELKKKEVIVEFVAEQRIFSMAKDRADINNRLTPGESGGALLCPNEMGEWIQIGVNSQTSAIIPTGYPFELPADFMKDPQNTKDEYGSLPFNASWINRVLNEFTHPHDPNGGTADWHKYVLDYEIEYTTKLLEKTFSCIKEKKDRFNTQTSPITYNVLKKELNRIEKKLKVAKKTTAKKVETPVFSRTTIRHILKQDLEPIYERCNLFR